MTLSRKISLLTTVATLGFCVVASTAYAADFTVANGQTLGAQTLTGGNTGTVAAGGTISTNGANGVTMTNPGNTMTNHGTTTTAGNNDDGINDAGGFSTIVNYGAITTSNDLAEGINLQAGAQSSTATNNGTITITGATAHGMHSSGPNTTLTNNGTITASGASSSGLAMSPGGSGMNMINNGTINISGATSYGLLMNVGANNASNTGTINHTGASGHAIYTNQIDNTLSNSGTVTTTGGNVDGMHAIGVSGTRMTNTGRITTSGASSDGMYANGANNTLTNRGTITTTGTNGDAMYNIGANAAITNYGTINTSGTNSDGIFLNGTGTPTISNYGSITTTGTGFAIVNHADDVLIINGGSLSSTGATAAIQSLGDNTVVRLMANSNITGNIVFTGANGTIEYDIGSAQKQAGDSMLTFNGTVTGATTTRVVGAALLPNAKVIQSGNSFAIVNAETFTGENNVATGANAQAGTLVDRHLQTMNARTPSGVSSGNGDHNQTQFWAEGFGSYRERPTDGNAAYSESTSYGGMAGIDFPQTASGYDIGVYLGGFGGEQEIGKVKFRTIESEGVMGGIYAGRAYGAYYITSQLATGFADNDSSRRVGNTFAKADYNSYYISPSLGVSRAVALDGVTLTPSLTARYTYVHADGYTETGSTLNQRVDDRSTSTLSGRAQVEARLNALNVAGGAFTPALRLGIEGETIIGGNDVDLVVLGQRVSFDPNGGDDVVDAIGGIHLSYDFANGPQIYTDIEASIGLNKGGSDDNTGGTAILGLRWGF